jgi:hypothetical protein
LVHKFPSSVAAAHALVGIQAQLLPAAGLALWNRTPRLTHQLFSEIVLQRRCLIRTWGQRGTLHLYAKEDWPLIIASLSPRSYHEAYGFTDDAAGRQRHMELLALVESEILARGRLGRKGLRDSGLSLPEMCYNQWGGVFYDLAIRGRVCLADREGAEGVFAHREHWLPGMEWPELTYETANLELWRRYLNGYGPASMADFVYWSGRKATKAKAWRKDLEDEVEEIDGPGGPLLRLSGEGDLAEAPERGRWPCRLLYRFDPLLLSGKDRSWIVPEECWQEVSRPAAVIEGVLLSSADGMACATWRYERAKHLMIRIVPFDRLREEDLRQAREQASRLGPYFGLDAKVQVAGR